MFVPTFKNIGSVKQDIMKMNTYFKMWGLLLKFFWKEFYIMQDNAVPAWNVYYEDKFQYEPECYYEQHKAKDLTMVPQDLTDVLAANVLDSTVHDYHNVHIPEKVLWESL